MTGSDMEPAFSSVKSIKAIDKIIGRCTRELNQLRAGGLESDPVITYKKADLVLIKIKLKLIHSDVAKLCAALPMFEGKKGYASVSDRLKDTLNDVEEKIFVNSRALARQTRNIENEKSKNIEEEPKENIESTHFVVEKDSDLQSLRHRLLSSGAESSILDSSKNSNKYHDNHQSVLIDELTSLSSGLKDGAMAFSSKIAQDLKLVESTESNFTKNTDYAQKIGGNLNKYLMNKSGNKISLFWLVKAFAGVLFSFIIVVVIIKITPHF